MKLEKLKIVALNPAQINIGTRNECHDASKSPIIVVITVRVSNR